MVSVCMICQSYYLRDPRVRREAEALAEAGFKVDIITGCFSGFISTCVNIIALEESFPLKKSLTFNETYFPKDESAVKNVSENVESSFIKAICLSSIDTS